MRAVKIPKGRWSKPISGERMYEVGKAYRERAEKMQRRPATVVESPRAQLERLFKKGPSPMKPYYQERVGDYVIELPTREADYIVRKHDASVAMSEHVTMRGAMAAVLRYQERDKRRRV